MDEASTSYGSRCVPANTLYTFDGRNFFMNKLFSFKSIVKMKRSMVGVVRNTQLALVFVAHALGLRCYVCDI